VALSSPAQAEPIRAAQYLRMSTDQQRYSLEHQAAALATYAAERGYVLVRTYEDAGISGVRLHNREGLKQLLADVVTGAADFTRILTYDVSRWGRFQDPDQAAHYEFLCREAGVSIEYCAEPFENDGGLGSTLVKQLKRAMAAEYSRDLSAKVSHAQSRHAQAGFWQGGPPGFALRRQVVNPNGSPGPILNPGEGKMRDCRVVIVAGPEDEADTVRSIFRMFVVGGMSRRTVATALNAEGLTAEGGARWTAARVAQVLTNEKYAGVLVFGKVRYFLGQRQVERERTKWIRTTARFAPIVSRELYDAAQRNIATRFRRMDREQMLEGLRELLAVHGRLNSTLIHDAEFLPCPIVYARRFGGLLNAYRLVGYEPKGRTLAASKVVRKGVPRPRWDRVPRNISREAMIESLKALYNRTGRLSCQIIDDAPDVASVDTIRKAFGSLINVYEMVGYQPDSKQILFALAASKRRSVTYPSSQARPLIE
jgi:DNA invertase Pin-like site-specific DNA recombinase